MATLKEVYVGRVSERGQSKQHGESGLFAVSFLKFEDGEPLGSDRLENNAPRRA